MPTPSSRRLTAPISSKGRAPVKITREQLDRALNEVIADFKRAVPLWPATTEREAIRFMDELNILDADTYVINGTPASWHAALLDEYRNGLKAFLRIAQPGLWKTMDPRKRAIAFGEARGSRSSKR